ncbi:Hachiman antiphage defense system protein HamA [Arthrobacter sp. LS16]|uniref:Hachiman antiphage defense system protein HamA n=1 Tax=Arthrobacter sp. 'calajunan' TaxID=1690248 RepID=UPI003C76887D
MDDEPDYVSGLTKAAETLTCEHGENIEVWHLEVPFEEAILTDWARKFRQNYCRDNEIDELRRGTGFTRSQYLLELCFPSNSISPGPGIRSGDFAELLVSDWVQYKFGFWVSRLKYANKSSPNESAKGVDVMGFRESGIGAPKSTDQMLMIEVKAGLSGNAYRDQLQKAIDGSSNDMIRAGYTLNSMKQLHRNRGDADAMKRIERYQSIVDNPFSIIYGAVAVLSNESFDADAIACSTTDSHSDKNKLRLFVIRGEDLMTLVHSLYQKAADEA